MNSLFALYDYRQKVSELYYRTRNAGSPPEQRHTAFRKDRDKLISTHPQSALTESQKSAFSGLNYFPYDANLRFVLPINDEIDHTPNYIELAQDGRFAYKPAGKVTFEISGIISALTLYWISGYGGGLFLPFRDSTNGEETYGGGRYLLDTIKGADLGMENGNLVLDFNFAYHPSCAYNEGWHCPLAPPENRLSGAIRAGERL